MSDFDDSLSINVRVALDEADREYEAFKKRLESDPIRVPVLTVPSESAGGTRTSRAFGGEMLPGGVMESLPHEAAVQRGPGLQEQVQHAAVQRVVGSPVEGAGLGTFRPLPGAAQNSVYGPLGYARAGGPYGSTQILPGASEAGVTNASGMTAALEAASGRVGRLPQFGPQLPEEAARDRALRRDYEQQSVRQYRYGQYVERRQEAGVIGPAVAEERFAEPVERLRAADEFKEARSAARQRYDEDTDAFRQYQAEQRAARKAARSGGGGRPPDEPGDKETLGTAFRKSLRGIGIALFAERATVGLASAFNEAEEAKIAAGGERYALARASIENNVARNFVGGIPLFGNAAIQLGELATGSTANANRTLQSAQFQDAAGQERLRNVVASRAAGYGALASQASLAGGTSGQIQAIANDISAADDSVSRQFARDAASASATQRRDAAIASGNADAAAEARAQVLTAQASADAGIAARRSASVDALRGLTQRTTDDTRAVVTGERFAGEAFGLRGRGDTFEAQIAEARGRAQPGIDQTQEEFIRLANLPIQSDPTARAAQLAEREANSVRRETQFAEIARQTDNINANRARFGIGLAGDRQASDLAFGGFTFDAQRAQIESQFRQSITTTNGEAAEGSTERIAAEQQRNIALRDVAQQQARFVVGQQGALAAGRLALNGNPLGATLTSLQSQFEAATYGQTPGSDAYNAAEQTRDLATAQARQQFGLTRQSIGNSLGAESRSLDYALDRNPIGAQVAGIAGEAANTLQELGQRGVGDDLVEQARSNYLRRVELERQDYRYSFRPEQLDQNQLLSPRDFTDPGRVGAAFEEAMGAISGVDAYSGLDRSGQDGGTPTVKVDGLPSAQDIGEAVREALASLMAR